MNDRLSVVTDGVWVARAPLRYLGLFELGSRMTVMRVGDGLVLHSPVAVDDELKEEVDALGDVRFVIAPNAFHHIHAGDAVKAWPSAKFLAPKALRAKRKDLRIDDDVEAAAPSAWGSDLRAFPIEGSMLKETVYFHAPTRTLVGADLFENFTHVDHWLTRKYLEMGGVYGRPGWHPLLRFVYRDRKAAKASVEKLFDLELDKIVIAHGDVVMAKPKETLREALSFLLD